MQGHIKANKKMHHQSQRDNNTPLQSRDCQLHLKHEKGSDLPHLKMASHASK